MEELYNIYRNVLQRTDTAFVRYLYDEIDWTSDLIVITGSRGVGKTTLMVQHILLTGTEDESLYVDADSTYFSSNSLYDTASAFYKNNGKVFYIDEVHKYEGWSKEIKMMHDYLPGLKIVVTGSSILEIKRGMESDLSRRAINYTLPGLSFREYLNFRFSCGLPPASLDEILGGKVKFPEEIGHPLPVFRQYLQNGYFPFFNQDNYLARLNNVINQTLEVDIPQYARLNASTAVKLKRLLYIIASNVPFKPNFTEIGGAIGADRGLVSDYMTYMEKAGLTRNLTIESTGMNLLEKIDKIYLGNTNFIYSLNGSNPEIGNVRETFFFAAMSVRNKVYSSPASDFSVAGHTFEVGGRSKKKKQIQDIADAFVVKDDIEYGHGNVLPLWSFGMNY